MKKYKQKVRKNQKLFTFYVEDGKLNPKDIPTPQECLLLILQKKQLVIWFIILINPF